MPLWSPNREGDPLIGPRGDDLLRRSIRARTAASLPSSGRIEGMRRFARALAVLVAATCALVLVDWALDLRSEPDQTRMKINGALVGLVLTVVLAFMARPGGPQARHRKALQGVIVAALVLPVLTLVQYATGVSLGIDDPFGLDAPSPATADPGRIPDLAAVCLVALAAAQLMLLAERYLASQVMAVVVGLGGLLPVVGHAYGIERFYRLDTDTNAIAAPTGVVLVLLAVSLLALQAGTPNLTLLVGNTIGGVVVRRLLPAVVGVPLVLGALCVVGLRQGWYSVPVGIAGLMSVVTVVGTVMVLRLAHRMRQDDLRRSAAEDTVRLLQEAVAEREALAASLTRAEAHQRSIIASASDAYVAADLSGRVTEWNRAAERIFGWTREQAVGTDVEDLIIPPEHVEAHRAGLDRFRTTGEGTILGRSVALEGQRADGSRVPVEVTLWAVRADGPDGVATAHVHAFVRDVTDRVNSEAELRRVNEELEMFASIAAHDLRTPLTVVQGYAELLMAIDDVESPEQRAVHERAGKILAASKRGARLIDDLLAYASVGHGSLDLVPTDLAELASAAAADVVKASDRGAVFDAGEMPLVLGDRRQLGQLIGNLIGNAVKYVPADRTPEVRVEGALEPGGDTVLVRVIDNGVSIPIEEHERLFQPFVRGSTSEGLTGTGIGLAICRSIAERHGGTIWIEPGDGPGTTFALRLRAAPGNTGVTT